MKSKLPYFYKILKVCILLITFSLIKVYPSSNFNNIKNSNLEKTLDLNALQVMNNDIINYQENIKNEYNNQIISSAVGNLTAYTYDCPTCNKKLACDSAVDLSNGNVMFNDNDYGNVRIVASSKKYPCGTIVRFNKKSLSEDPIIAIVLDRGVNGNTLDILVENDSIATNNVGRSKINYDVLRSGWKRE